MRRRPRCGPRFADWPAPTIPTPAHRVRPNHSRRSTRHGGCWATQSCDTNTTDRWRWMLARRHLRRIGRRRRYSCRHPSRAFPGVSWRSWRWQGSASCYWACSPTPPSNPGPPDNLLEPGSCVVLEDNGDASEVNCDTRHDGVVESLLTADQRCPADVEPHRDRQGLGVVCLRLGA